MSVVQTLLFSLSSGTTADARRLTLPNGSSLTLLVRDGVVYIPNPELAKLLPSITRNVMESLRSTYSITVYHANKAEIGILKNLGILGVKAGRSLVYRAVDVAKMFDHWHTAVPEFLKELCDGKVCMCVCVCVCVCECVSVCVCVCACAHAHGD